MEENTASSNQRANFARYAVRDERAAATVRRMEIVFVIFYLVLILLIAGYPLYVFITFWSKEGFFSGLLEGVLYGIGFLVLFGLLGLVVNFLMLKPWRAIRYNMEKKRMVKEVSDFGLDPALLHQWSSPYPGAGCAA